LILLIVGIAIAVVIVVAQQYTIDRPVGI